MSDPIDAKSSISPPSPDDVSSHDGDSHTSTHYSLSPSLLRLIHEVLNDSSGSLEESLSFHQILDPHDVVMYDVTDFDELTSAPDMTITRRRGALSPSELSSLRSNLNRKPLHLSKKKLLMVLKGYIWQVSRLLHHYQAGF